LFSATVPAQIKDVARKFLSSNYAMVDLVGNDENKSAKKVRHFALCCDWKTRGDVLGDLVKVHAGVDGRAIIFTNTKAECNSLALNSSLGTGIYLGHSLSLSLSLSLGLSGLVDN
jgi:ATP-dependent RNA helicase DDX21